MVCSWATFFDWAYLFTIKSSRERNITVSERGSWTAALFSFVSMSGQDLLFITYFYIFYTPVLQNLLTFSLFTQSVLVTKYGLLIICGYYIRFTYFSFKSRLLFQGNSKYLKQFFSKLWKTVKKLQRGSVSILTYA